MTQKEKSKETRDNNKALWSKQVMIFGDWTLKRFDEQNCAIIRKGFETRPWYYGRLLHAIRDIPHKLLSEGDKQSLADISAQLEDIRKIIDRLDLTFLKTRDSKGELFSI